MKELIKGANTPLVASGKVRIRLSWRTVPSELDFTCFALDAHDRVLADDWFVFYNQTASPGGAVRLDPRQAEFLINLDALPGAVQKCSFIATLGAGSFRDANDITFTAVPAAGESALFRVLEPTDNRSLLLAELYRYKNTWKIRAKGEGLKQDLASLAQAFGVDVMDRTLANSARKTREAIPPQRLAPTHARASTAPPTSLATPPDPVNPQPVPRKTPPLEPLPPPTAAAPVQPGPRSTKPQPVAIPPHAAPTAAPAAPAHPVAPPTPPYDRHEKLKTYATLVIAFGSLTTAVTTLVTQCTPRAPVVLIQPQTGPTTAPQSGISDSTADEKPTVQPKPRSLR